MSAHEQGHDSDQMTNPSGYDKHDVSVLGITLVAIGSIIFLVISGALLDTNYVFEREKISQEQTLKPRDPRWTTLHEQEVKRMNSYGYADTLKVMAHIPIDSAMELVLKERGATTSTSLPSTGTGK